MIQSYDKLCLATGTSPIYPNVKGGVNYSNVHVVRSHNDQEAIKKASPNAKKIVIVGASFIGSETASALKLQYKEAIEVHIIGIEDVPFKR